MNINRFFFTILALVALSPSALAGYTIRNSVVGSGGVFIGAASSRVKGTVGQPLTSDPKKIGFWYTVPATPTEYINDVFASDEQNVEVAITVTSAEPFGSYSLTYKYPAGLADYVSVRNGALTAGWSNGLVVNANDSTGEITIQHTGTIASGTGTIVVIMLHLTTEGSGNHAIQQLVLSDASREVGFSGMRTNIARMDSASALHYFPIDANQDWEVDTDELNRFVQSWLAGESWFGAMVLDTGSPDFMNYLTKGIAIWKTGGRYEYVGESDYDTPACWEEKE